MPSDSPSSGTDDLTACARTVRGVVFGGPVPDSLSILPPFYCDYGLGASFGERVFINQGCFFLDFGGITIGDRVLIGPRVTPEQPPMGVVTGTSVVERKTLGRGTPVG